MTSQPHDTHPADMDRESWLRKKLLEVADEAALMVEVGSFQALMSARRLERNYRQDIDDLKAAQGAAEAFDPHDEEQVVSELVKLPDNIWRNPRILARIRACQ